MPSIIIDYKYNLWDGVKAHCPICKKTFTGWYCPTCGLPKKNSKYALSEYGTLHNCDSYHFRPEFASFEQFQLCDKCYTTNPSDAKYCRNCKNKLTKSRGITKDTHGWVDLGLSVLWATETMKSVFRWMSSEPYSENIHGDFHDNRNYKGEGKDAATEIWGAKWRTPTKEEFEELILKCKWERCIDPKSKKYALKATGPNGNSIMLKLSENDNILLWTSTEYTTEFEGKRAYAFQFSNDIKIDKTLTAKQIKEMEFTNARSKRESERLRIESEELFSMGDFSKATYSSILNLPGNEWEREKSRKEFEKRWAEKKKREDKDREISKQEQNILDAMGDDRQEREKNKIMDKEKRDNLWLSTPVEFKFNAHIVSNTMAIVAKRWARTILPVADKKWKGQL